jgi:hypothetical protein
MVVRLRERDMTKKTFQENLLVISMLEILQLITDLSTAPLVTDYCHNNGMNFSTGNFAFSYCIKFIYKT